VRLSTLLIFISIASYSETCLDFFEREQTVILNSTSDIFENSTDSTLAGKKVGFPDGRTFELGDMLGEGSFSYIYCIMPDCRKVIKVPSFSGAISSFRAEIRDAGLLERAGITTAKIYNRGNANPIYLIKEKITGHSLKEILSNGQLDDTHIADLAGIFVRSWNFSLPIDIGKPENFIWNGNIFVLVDSMLLSSQIATEPFSSLEFSFSGNPLEIAKSDFSMSFNNFHMNERLSASEWALPVSININSWRNNFFAENGEGLSYFNSEIAGMIGIKEYEKIEESSPE